MANRNRVPSPVLSLPPLEYDTQYFNNLVRLLNYFIAQQDNPGDIRGTSITLATVDTATGVQSASLPTSDTDPVTGDPYPSGTVWCDTTADNVLKIVL